MAFTTIKFLNTQGVVVARGSHTKYVAIAWKDDNNRIEEMKGEE